MFNNPNLNPAQIWGFSSKLPNTEENKILKLNLNPWNEIESKRFIEMKLNEMNFWKGSTQMKLVD